MVEIAGTLHSERRRQDAARGTLQRGTKSTVLELLLRRAGLAADRVGPVVPGKNPLELPVAALPFGVLASGGGPGDHRKFHDSHLHERFCGTRRIWFGDSRRCFAGIRQALSSRLV